MTWKELEEKTRIIAQARWNSNAIAETIAGIKCDCIIKQDSDHWIAIEVTTENNLSKVRDDINKLRTIKNALLVEDIYCNCYFVMEQTPTDSMRESGKANKIKVMSLEEFQNEYFDYRSYIHLRKQRSFGSLIDSETGEPENNTYIEVAYIDKKTGKELTSKDIVMLLKKGKRIILKGDFGLGKSRCIKELFDDLTCDPINNPYTIAINLRDHWGAKRCNEIILRHFEDLGLDAKSFMKTFDRSNIVYLLDGFDEIGTQSWSSDPLKMHHIREISVCALKDLVSKVQGGLFITGREYYFNSDSEMLSLLGLNHTNTIILDCQPEFKEAELVAFIQKNLKQEKEINIEDIPIWFPKRPLIIQLLLKYADDVFLIDTAFDDIYSFWHAFFIKICERESRIYAALNPATIQSVLLSLSNKTRICINDVGPISQSDLSQAFQEATGFLPNDESAILLQRLPSLGRVSADSPDRCFLDSFILNGLRAESIILMQQSWDRETLSTEWKNPLDEVGLSILAEYMNKNNQSVDSFLSLARNAAKNKNSVLASDIISALCIANDFNGDFKGIVISGGHFKLLSFEGKKIKRLTILDSVIEKIDLTNAKHDEGTVIKDCLISSVYGVASKNSLPGIIMNCEIENYESFSTISLIKKAKMSEPQRLFVMMLRKLFYQPGSGRKEAALLRGMGYSADKKMAERILNILMEEGIVTYHKGNEGLVYKPNRKCSNRIEKIMNDLTLSNDSLWGKVSKLI